MDLKAIAANYEKMSDNELISVATTNATGLLPELYYIIEQEIKKRNLDPNIYEGLLAQNKEYTIEELLYYAQILRNLPCPICSSTTNKLMASSVHTVKSFVIFTATENKPIIGCPSCLDKKNNQAILMTSLLGWWGLPFGLVKTPIYIYKNIKAKKENKNLEVNPIFISFIEDHIGEIAAYENNPEKLKEIISQK